MNILVADDSKTTLALIIASLQKLGHTVMPANCGQEAIDLFQKERPDLIILDVVMEGGMDGFECAKKIREISDENEEWIPIIFLSGSVDDVSIEKGINTGGDDYLTKPFSEVTLAAKIKAMQRISEMRKKLVDTTEELRTLSATDPLTGVYNRLQFERHLREKLAEADRHNFKLALLFIDIDHFKTINDSLGHHVGDLLLKDVAKRISSCLREEDFLARIGGDEFTIVLSYVDTIYDAGKTAQNIVNALAPIYSLENNSIRISVSIGIACYPELGTTHESFVQNADIAMYHAKDSGRNNFQYFTTELQEKYKQQVSLENDLKFALERKQLFVTYQPIYNLLSKKLVNVEALLRWQHPEFGVISPNIFIPLAEETGLIVEIGTWVLKEVCQQRMRWYNAGYKDFKIAVNLSLHQFLQENFFQVISDILLKTKLPPYLLELELTETTVIAYTNELKLTLKKLHDMGLGISIDDFGTRYSSLTSLRQLPVTTLKIDKAFLQDVSTDLKNSTIVKALIALGSNLNLDVIAEGIETDQQLQFLIVNGCFQGQGFLLSKALNEKDMTTYLSKDSRLVTLP